MSFYRSLITAVAAMGLATSVFAAEDAAAPAQAADAQQVAAASEAAPAADAAAPAADVAAAPAEKLNVNKATAKELMKVKGLNSARAKAIVAYRKKHGDFKTLDELKDVKGFKKMSDDKMKEVEDQLTAG